MWRSSKDLSRPRTASLPGSWTPTETRSSCGSRRSGTTRTKGPENERRLLSPDRVERPVTGIVAAGVGVLLGFDAVGALASKQFGFTYAFLIPGSLIIY